MDLGQEVRDVFDPVKQLVILLCTLISVPCAGTSAAIASELTVDLVTAQGEAARDVVLLLIPRGDTASTHATRKDTFVDSVEASEADMVQKDLQFTPFVLPVRKGASVSFPNQDKVRHHVYSFSKSKRFELKLYGGDETHAVVFDETGIVALGCNIHDDMLAYIVVTDAAYYGVSAEAGRITLSNVEPGAYTAQFWHPDLRRSKSPIEKSVLIENTGDLEFQMEIAIKSRPRPSKSTKRDGVEY